MLRRKSVRTIILRDYGWIVIINHPGSMEWKAGRARLVQRLLGALAIYMLSSTAQSRSSVSEFLIVAVVADSRASKGATNVSVI